MFRATGTSCRPHRYPASIGCDTALGQWAFVCFHRDAEPLIHMSLCPDKPIMAGFLGSFAPCSVSTFAGRHDRDVICLRRRVVNVTQSGCRVVSQKMEVYETRNATICVVRYNSNIGYCDVFVA